MIKNFKYRSITHDYPVNQVSRWSGIVSDDVILGILESYDQAALFSGPGVYAITDNISLEIVTTDPPSSERATHFISGMFKPVDAEDLYSLVHFAGEIPAIQVGPNRFKIHPDNYTSNLVTETLEGFHRFYVLPVALVSKPADSDWIFTEFDGDRLAAAQATQAAEPADWPFVACGYYADRFAYARIQAGTK